MKISVKKLQLLALSSFLLLSLTGCVSYDAAGNPTGWVYEYLGHPAAMLLNWLATMFGNNYGIAIIIVTILSRILMLPSSLKMTRSTIESSARMKVAKPEMDEIREELDQTTDPQEKLALNSELMAVQKKYGINMLGGLSGCLPLLLQMPFISAIYAAIRTSPEIKEASFLGMSLGETSLVLTIIVALVYGVQGWLSSQTMAPSDNPQAASTSKSMMLMNPLMLGWITYISAAGLGLYFLTGGVISLIQQIYMNNVARPKIVAEVEKELEKFKNMERKPRKKVTKASTTPSDRLIPTKNQVQASNPKRRNEGKQKRK